MRILIACDEAGVWYVRQIAQVVHGIVRDEMVYRCDKLIGKNFSSLEEAFEAAKIALKNRRMKND